MDKKLISLLSIYRKKIDDLFLKSQIINKNPNQNIKENIEYKDLLKKTSILILKEIKRIVPSIEYKDLDFDERGHIATSFKENKYQYKEYDIELSLHSSFQFNSCIFFSLKVSKDNDCYELDTEAMYETTNKKHFVKYHQITIKYFKDSKRHPVFKMKRKKYFNHKNLLKEIYILSKTGGGSLFINYSLTKKDEIKFKKFDYNYHSLLDKDETGYLSFIDKELSQKGYIKSEDFLEYKDYMQLIKDINVLDTQNDIFTKKYSKTIKILNK